MTTKDEFKALIEDRMQTIEANAKQMEISMTLREMDLEYQWAVAVRHTETQNPR